MLINMSPLAKMIIEALENEDEPTKEEIEIINNYIKNDSNDSVSLDDLAKDLGIDE